MATITKKMLVDNGWTAQDNPNGVDWYATLHHHEGWYAEYDGSRKILKIWEEKPDDAYWPDVFVRTAELCWQFQQAFRLAGINYRILTPISFKHLQRLLNSVIRNPGK